MLVSRVELSENGLAIYGFRSLFEVVKHRAQCALLPLELIDQTGRNELLFEQAGRALLDRMDVRDANETCGQ